MGKIRDMMIEQLRLRNYSRQTIKAYLIQIRALVRYTGKSPDQITEEELKRYFRYLVYTRCVSTSYRNQAVSAVKFLYRHVLKSPVRIADIPRPKREYKLPAVLSVEEIMRMFSLVRNRKHLAIMVLAYSSGMRVSELAGLKVSDIDSDRMMIHVRGGKGRKDRYTVLSDIALEVLRDYAYYYKPQKWLFPGGRKGRHITPRTIQNVVTKSAECAGLKKHVTTHTLRHSFATHLLENGIGLRYIQELLGHKSAKTTQKYTHVAKKKIERIISPLDTICRQKQNLNENKPAFTKPFNLNKEINQRNKTRK